MHTEMTTMNPSTTAVRPDRILRGRARHRLAACVAATVVIASCGGSSDPERADVDVVGSAPGGTVATQEGAPPDTDASPDDPPETTVEAETVDTAPDEPEPDGSNALVVACVPGTGGDFSGVDLPSRSFDGEDLRCADFTGADLSQPRFSNVDARGAIFVGAGMSQPRFDGFVGIGADFTDASFAQGSFVDSDLRGAVLTEASFAQTRFENTICPDGRNSDDVGGTCEAAAASLPVTFDPNATDSGSESDAGSGDLEDLDELEDLDQLDELDGLGDVEPRAPESLVSCSGFAVGRYSGDDQGPIVARLDDDGTLSTVFVSPATIDVDITDVGDIGDLGLEIGEDITIGAGGVTINSSAITVDASGVRLGNIELDLVEVGSVDAAGNIVAVATTGALVTGTYDFATCTASGTWINVDVTGTWQVGPSASVVRFGADDCDGGVFIGASNGGIDIDLDAGCLSTQVGGLSVDSATAIDDVSVAVGDGLVAYTLSDAVLFELDSFAITDDARDRLEAIAADIRERGGDRIEVIGHTDALGSDAYNLELSRARAAAVVGELDALVGDLGITRSASGLGESQPVAANQNPDGTDNPDGRALNRRVEIVLVS